jgi:retinol dehydrogenase 13
MKNKKFAKYFREYQLSNILAMIRNNRLDPEICTDNFNNGLVVITGSFKDKDGKTIKEWT